MGELARLTAAMVAKRAWPTAVTVCSQPRSSGALRVLFANRQVCNAYVITRTTGKCSSGAGKRGEILGSHRVAVGCRCLSRRASAEQERQKVRENEVIDIAAPCSLARAGQAALLARVSASRGCLPGPGRPRAASVPAVVNLGHINMICMSALVWAHRTCTSGMPVDCMQPRNSLLMSASTIFGETRPRRTEQQSGGHTAGSRGKRLGAARCGLAAMWQGRLRPAGAGAISATESSATRWPPRGSRRGQSAIDRGQAEMGRR